MSALGDPSSPTNISETFCNSACCVPFRNGQPFVPHLLTLSCVPHNTQHKLLEQISAQIIGPWSDSWHSVRTNGYDHSLPYHKCNTSIVPFHLNPAVSAFWPQWWRTPSLSFYFWALFCLRLLPCFFFLSGSKLFWSLSPNPMSPVLIEHFPHMHLVWSFLCCNFSSCVFTVSF